MARVKKNTRITIKLTPVELQLLSYQLESNIQLLADAIKLEELEANAENPAPPVILTEERRMVSTMKVILMKVKSKLVGVVSNG